MLTGGPGGWSRVCALGWCRYAVGGYVSPSHITDWVLLGNREDAADFINLVSLGVSHVLNATAQLPNAHPR